MKRVALFDIFETLFNVWLNNRRHDDDDGVVVMTERVYIQSSAVDCFKVCEENLASPNCIAGKRKSILIAFSDGCECCSLILHQNSSGSFLKVSCSIESETVSMNFLCSVTSKSTGGDCTLNTFVKNYHTNKQKSKFSYFTLHVLHTWDILPMRDFITSCISPLGNYWFTELC